MSAEERIDYPIEEERTTIGEPLEMGFSTYTHYGSHDRDSQFHYLTEIVNSAGQTFRIGDPSNEWSELFPGVEVREDYGESRGERSSSTKSVFVRIQPEACPVILRIDEGYSYSSEHYNEHTNKQYAIRIVKGEPDR